MKYSDDTVRTAVADQEERLFASWSSGRPQGWKCDDRTRNIVCVGLWLREELFRVALSDSDRKAQEAQFNRRSRSEMDVFAIAADILNETVEDKIDRNRIPTRRWG